MNRKKAKPEMTLLPMPWSSAGSKVPAEWGGVQVAGELRACFRSLKGGPARGTEAPLLRHRSGGRTDSDHGRKQWLESRKAPEAARRLDSRRDGDSIRTSFN